MIASTSSVIAAAVGDSEMVWNPLLPLYRGRHMHQQHFRKGANVSIWSNFWASASKLALALFNAAAPPRAVSMSGSSSLVVAAVGGIKITAADIGSFVGTIEAVSGQLKTLIADPTNAANNRDLAEQVAAIAADALIPDPIEREIGLAIFDMIVSNMQSPSVTGANMASPIAPSGQRYFGR